MAETWNKKEREKKKQANKKEKAEKKQERKDSSKGDNSLESMFAYLDENGNLSSKPPDPKKKIIINVEDIEIGVPKQGPMNPDDLIRKGKKKLSVLALNDIVIERGSLSQLINITIHSERNLVSEVKADGLTR